MLHPPLRICHNADQVQLLLWALLAPLDKGLTDKILWGEYIDFTMLLPDSLTRPQTPDIQLRLNDSVPGSSAPLTMVRKRKPDLLLTLFIVVRCIHRLYVSDC